MWLSYAHDLGWAVLGAGREAGRPCALTIETCSHSDLDRRMLTAVVVPGMYAPVVLSVVCMPRLATIIYKPPSMYGLRI